MQLTTNKKLINIITLLRLDNPTGYLLVFFPAAFGICLAEQHPINLLIIPLFFLCSISIRAIGCIINDILDKNFDKKVYRTKNRPIANGAITIKKALMILTLLSLLNSLILLILSKTALIFSLCALIMMIIYPLMKRYITMPQIFLGFTFNLGCLIGYTTLTNKITVEIIILYIGCIFWTIGYDTIYAFMDIEDDKKINLKSSAIFLENKPYKLVIMLCYCFFTILFSVAVILGRQTFPVIPIITIIICQIIFTYQVIILNTTKAQICLKCFKMNVYIGIILLISMIINCIYPIYNLIYYQ